MPKKFYEAISAVLGVSDRPRHSKLTNIGTAIIYMYIFLVHVISFTLIHSLFWLTLGRTHYYHSFFKQENLEVLL